MSFSHNKSELPIVNFGDGDSNQAEPREIVKIFEKQGYIVTGSKYKLVPFGKNKEAELSIIKEIYSSNLTKVMHVSEKKTDDESILQIWRKNKRLYNETDTGRFLIMDKRSNEMLGLAGLTKMGVVNDKNRDPLEFSISLPQYYTSKGLGSNVIEDMREQIFDTIFNIYKADIFYSEALPYNIASNKCLRKFGFKPCGIMPWNVESAVKSENNIPKAPYTVVYNFSKDDYELFKEYPNTYIILTKSKQHEGEADIERSMNSIQKLIGYDEDIKQTHLELMKGVKIDLDSFNHGQNHLR